MTSKKERQASFVTLEALRDKVADSVFSGEPPRTYAHTLPGPIFAPGSMTLIGAPPAVGKTALITQAIFSLLQRDETVRALIANVEMSPERLLERQLARLSGVACDVIRGRVFPEKDHELLSGVFDDLVDIEERLAFVTHPFTVENIANCVGAFRADIIVIDYLQRIVPKSAEPGADAKSRAAALMDELRKFCNCGGAAVVISAVGRQRGANGSSYEGLGLGSFRDSSEIEYGADEAYILGELGGREGGRMRLQHLKSRDGDLQNWNLVFNRPLQSFTLDPDQSDGGGEDSTVEIDLDDATPEDVLQDIEAIKNRRKASQAASSTPTEAQWNQASRAATNGRREGRS